MATTDEVKNRKRASFHRPHSAHVGPDRNMPVVAKILLPTVASPPGIPLVGIALLVTCGNVLKCEKEVCKPLTHKSVAGLYFSRSEVAGLVGVTPPALYIAVRSAITAVLCWDRAPGIHVRAVAIRTSAQMPEYAHEQRLTTQQRQIAQQAISNCKPWTMLPLETRPPQLS